MRFLSSWIPGGARILLIDLPLITRQQSRRERSSEKKRELAGARGQRQIQHPWTTTSSYAATVTGSAVRGSASTATAGTAALPQTDIYGCKLHCLPRQTDANNNAQLSRFNSKFLSPGCSAVDFLSQKWHDENKCLPVSFIVDVIRHAHACRAVGTLIVPEWQSGRC